MSIDTGSLNLEGLAQMAHLLETRLQALGLKSERRQATGGARADIVIATLRGSGTKKNMLQAHMDTMYQSGILQSQPIREDGNKLYGPGIGADKGGIAVIPHALKILPMRAGRTAPR